MTRHELEQLIAVVEAESTSAASWLHGPQHWKCVARTGIRLARATEGASPLVAFLFGLFHDSMRENDDEDEKHGERGARLAQELAGRGLLSISEDHLTKLLYACETHTEGDPTEDPMVGVCYDADRLNLWRVRIRPKKKYLSTPAGKASCEQEDTRYFHNEIQAWSKILDLLFEE